MPMILFPFHATASEYSDEQSHAYHDHSECAEGKKLRNMHRIDGTGGRRRCKECARISRTYAADQSALDSVEMRTPEPTQSSFIPKLGESRPFRRFSFRDRAERCEGHDREHCANLAYPSVKEWLLRFYAVLRDAISENRRAATFMAANLPCLAP